MIRYSIEIQQHLKNGLLGGPRQSKFSVVIESVSYDILIEQMGTRKITLATDTEVESDDLLRLFNELDMLLMLGEGKLRQVFNARFFTDGIPAESDSLNEEFAFRLKKFDSADFTVGSHSTFLSFDKYLNEKVFTSWHSIYKELDILHHMVLYSMADTGMTIDLKCIFLIEAFEALAELVEKHDLSFKCPIVKKMSRN